MHNTVISNIDKLTGKMKGTDREKKIADADQGRLASEGSTKEDGRTPRCRPAPIAPRGVTKLESDSKYNPDGKASKHLKRQ